MQALHPTECTVFLMLENSSLWKRLNSCEGQGPSSPQAQSRCWTGAQPEGRQRWSPSPAHPVSSTCWSLVIPSTGFLLGVRLAKLISEVKKKLSVRMKAWKKTGLDTAGVALGKFLALSKIHTWSQTVNREGSVKCFLSSRPMGSSPSITSWLQSMAWGAQSTQGTYCTGCPHQRSLTPNMMAMLVL